jgi:hypothetical protein
VRGTQWLTVDRCDGTLVNVRRGTVLVTNRRTSQRTVLKTGQTYVALADRKRSAGGLPVPGREPRSGAPKPKPDTPPRIIGVTTVAGKVAAVSAEVTIKYSDSNGCGGLLYETTTTDQKTGATRKPRTRTVRGPCVAGAGQLVESIPCEVPGRWPVTVVVTDPTGRRSSPRTISFGCDPPDRPVVLSTFICPRNDARQLGTDPTNGSPLFYCNRDYSQTGISKPTSVNCNVTITGTSGQRVAISIVRPDGTTLIRAEGGPFAALTSWWNVYYTAAPGAVVPPGAYRCRAAVGGVQVVDFGFVIT